MLDLTNNTTPQKCDKATIHSSTRRHFGLCYTESMKKKKQTKQVRISLKHYELIRRVAFRAHKPMTAILEEIINRHEPRTKSN
jgi:hypothetical protein